MTRSYSYLTVEDALYVVQRLGMYVRDPGALESALHRPTAVVFGQESYPDLFSKAGALMDAICRSHPLVDGNKRLAWLSAVMFLARHGYQLTADPHDVDAFVRQIAGEHAPLEAIVEWIAAHVDTY